MSRQKIDPIERIVDWAIEAPLADLIDMAKRLEMIRKVRERANAPVTEVKRGRPIGSRNRPSPVPPEGSAA